MLKTIKNNKSWLVFLSLIFLGCFLFGEISLAVDSAGDVMSISDVGVNTEYKGLTQAYKNVKEDVIAVGSKAAGYGSGILLKGVNFILFAIYMLVMIFFSISMWFLDLVISPKLFENVFFSPVGRAGINTAWSFVRDFFNLFFILIVVLIGLSTILGVSKFKDKTMLMRVALAAMLINFSKPLTLFVIDLSQVFMRFFAESIARMEFSAQLSKLINFENIASPNSLGFESNFAYFVIIITVIVMLLVMTVMIFSLAISLVVRLVAFWVLIILSPLAMFGFAMEGTKFGSMKDEWVKDLLSWCFYGPIMLFFLWLAIILASALSGAIVADQTLFDSAINVQKLDANNPISAFFMRMAGILIPYITAVYLLFYGYDKAKKTSSGMATKILDAGSKKISDWGATARKAAYQTTLPGTREAIGGAAKDRVERYEGKGQWATRSLTKKGREDLQAERNAKWKKSVGGDEGAAKRSYYQGKAQEKLKEWKNSPPDDEKLKRMFDSKNKNEAERVAATLYKSQNNQLGIDDDGNNQYAKAMENLKGHQGLQDSIKRETGRENMGAVVNYETQNKLKEAQEAGGVLHGVLPTDPVYKAEEERISKKIHEKKLGKKSLKNIFKNQQQSFYLDKNGDLRPGVLEFLHDKAKTKPDQISRKKFADELGDNEVIEAIRNAGTEGKYVLGDV